jgi:hypothetical protein
MSVGWALVTTRTSSHVGAWGEGKETEGKEAVSARRGEACEVSGIRAHTGVRASGIMHGIYSIAVWTGSTCQVDTCPMDTCNSSSSR